MLNISVSPVVIAGQGNFSECKHAESGFPKTHWFIWANGAKLIILLRQDAQSGQTGGVGVQNNSIYNVGHDLLIHKGSFWMPF